MRNVLAAAAAEPSVLQVVLMGMITVFIGLIALIGIIKLMGLIMAWVEGQKARPAPAAAQPRPAPAPAAPARGGAPANGWSTVSPMDQRQTVAAIASAIAEEMGEDVSHIRITSIRKL